MRIVATLLFLLLAERGLAAEVGPFKDDLFAYPAILSEADGGAYRVVGYDEQRDINGRDEVPELRVRSKYVSLRVRRFQQELVAETAAGRVPHFAVGKTDGAKLIVVFIHGKGGNRKLGVNDYTFGGNFNRLKNLVAEAGGLYLSPDARFDDAGVSRIEALISDYAARSPGAPVVVACGSMGNAICYGLSARPVLTAVISGYVVLSGYPDSGLLASPAVRQRKPFVFAQGSGDKVFEIAGMETLFRQLRGKANYPTEFIRFEGGSHGTPIRMIDWRETLNWILSAR